MSYVRRSAQTDSTGEALNLYLLKPIASPDDPRWSNMPCQGEVVVAARTTGDARIIAARQEIDFMEVDAPGDVGTRHSSAFLSEKLYDVIELEHGRMGLDRGVIAGEIAVGTRKPTQV